MALQLFKLVMTATTTTTANPASYNYFYKIGTAAINTASPLTFVYSLFQGDDGSTATAFQAVTSNNGYTSLYVNGQLQEGGYTRLRAAVSH